MSEENKAVDRRWFEEIWNQGKVSAFPELVSRDLVVHNPPVGIPGTFDGIQQSISIHRAGFPDLHFDIDAHVAEGTWWLPCGPQRALTWGSGSVTSPAARASAFKA